MNLSFKRRYPWGGDTDFMNKIKSGVKIHTIRMGNRWKPGDLIDFWSENPRNVTVSPHRFDVDFDRALSWKTAERNSRGAVNLPVCSAVEDFMIRIDPIDGDLERYGFIIEFAGITTPPTVIVDLLAMNDGFENRDDLFRWFYELAKKKKMFNRDMIGQVIHWTDQVYNVNTATTLDHHYFRKP